MTLTERFQSFSTQEHQFKLLVKHSSSIYQADIADRINCQWSLFYQHVVITVIRTCCIKLCSRFMVSVPLCNELMQFYSCSLTLNFWQITSLSSMVEVMAYSNINTKPLPKSCSIAINETAECSFTFFGTCSGSNYNLIYMDVIIPVWEIPLTVIRSSYHHNGISYTGNVASLY